MQKFSISLLFLLTACSAERPAAENAAENVEEVTVGAESGAVDAGDPPPDEVTGSDQGSTDMDPDLTAEPEPSGSSGGFIAKAITIRDGERLSWCGAVGKRTTAEDCAGYAEEVANLSEGVAAFDPPRQMVAGQMVVVRLGIARDGSSSPPRAQEMIGGGKSTELRDVVIGAKMRAQLSGGRAFEIDPSEPQDKFMGRARERVWAWNVTPLLAGKHGLSATITVLAEDGTILDNFESKAIEVDVAVSADAERDAKRDRTRKDLAWYQELGRSLTELWWVWIGLAIAVAVGIWRFVHAARTGKDPAAESKAAGAGDAGAGKPPADPAPTETDGQDH